MPSPTHARLFVAGTDAMARPMLARVELDLLDEGADEARIDVRRWLDPVVRSGRGGSPAVITALAQIGDRRGAAWLLALVERGRPRLIDPDRLTTVALLGRRREWRAAAATRSPFLPVICDRPPLRVGEHEFMLTRALGGGVDLLRVRPGDPIERWWLGEIAGRPTLLANAGVLALVAGGRVAIIDVAELIPGGRPLIDPRDVELELRWCSLPEPVAGVCDLLDGPTLRVIERDAERSRVTELELDSNGSARRRASWAIEPPRRWLASAGSLWLASADTWTRVAAGEGPCERFPTLAGGGEAATIEWSSRARPWLWLWDDARRELHRVDGLAPSERRRWSVPLAHPLRAQHLLAFCPGPVVDPDTVTHADELAELLALEPELATAWASCFDR